jgi:hypothetical protein
VTERTVAEHERPAWAPLTLVAFAILVAFTNIGGIFWAKLLDWGPWSLLVFSSRNRYLVLSLGADVWEPAYWTIAPLRIAAAFFVTHMIGRAYGDVVLGWFTKYLGVTYEAIQQFNRLYDRAHWFAIPFFVGSNLLGALSGIRRTPLKRVFVLVAIGIYLRLALIRVLALLFEDQLERFVGWVQRYSWWAVGISLVIVVAVNARNLRRGGAV